MNRRVLFVDDEPNLLEGIRRQLRRRFEVTTAIGADEALRIIAESDTFAIIVSDMRMPGKTGIEFLSEIQNITPDSVRMMLTGNADQQTAIDAVNHGQIFRFLNKPCETVTLITNLEAGLRQYELIISEQQLLEETLKGSIKVLTDILALSNPAAFSRAKRIKYYVSFIAKKLRLPDSWQYDIAAMLSQIGCITIPTEIMEKLLSGAKLNEREEDMFAEHSQYACNLLKHIPRMGNVARMIAEKDNILPDNNQSDPVTIGAQMLRTAEVLDLLLTHGKAFPDALKEIQATPHIYNASVIETLKDVPPPKPVITVTDIPINDLQTGMILADDIRGPSDVLVAYKGQKVSKIMERRLKNLARQNTISGNASVYIDGEESES